MRLNTARQVLTSREWLVLRLLGTASESAVIAAHYDGDRNNDPAKAALHRRLASEYRALARLR